MKRGQYVLLVVIALFISGLIYFDALQYLSFESIKLKQLELQTWVEENGVIASVSFFAVYVLATTFSVPGAALLTLLAGALFGLFHGFLLVSFASTIGATLAFLGARYLFKDMVQNKFGDRLKIVNEGVEKEGALYLFGLRLVPLLPFFVVNLVMSVTPIKTRTFYLASQLGMVAGTLVYVNAGTQLAKLDSLSAIRSPGLIFSFILLAISPFAAKYVLKLLRANKV